MDKKTSSMTGNSDSWDQALLGDLKLEDKPVVEKGIRQLSLEKRPNLLPATYLARQPAIVPLKKFLVPFLGLTIFVVFVLDMKVFPQFNIFGRLTQVFERIDRGVAKVAGLSNFVTKNQLASINATKEVFAQAKVKIPSSPVKMVDFKQQAFLKIARGLLATGMNAAHPIFIFSVGSYRDLSQLTFVPRLQTQLRRELAMLTWMNAGLVADSQSLIRQTKEGGSLALTELKSVKSGGLVAMVLPAVGTLNASSSSGSNGKIFTWFNQAYGFASSTLSYYKDIKGFVSSRVANFCSSLTDYIANLPTKSILAWKEFLGLNRLADKNTTSDSVSIPSIPVAASATSSLDAKTEEQLRVDIYNQLKKELEASIKSQMKTAIIQSTGGSISSSGLVVYPSSGSSTLDYQKQQQVQSAFSDKVVINFDRSGQSGVITPIFKSAVGGNYLFVLTPVNK